VARRPNVSKLERRHDVAGLGAAARFRDVVPDQAGRPVDLGVDVRTQAVDALGRVDDQSATPALLDALRDDSHQVRTAAVAALGRRSDPAATDGLATAALGVDELSTVALQALDARMSPDVAHRLAVAYLDGHQGTDEAGAETLCRAISSLSEPRVILETVVARLGSADRHTRERAGRVLAAYPEQSRDLLLAALRDERLRDDAALALGRLRDSVATPALCDLLDAPSTETRRAAAWALGQIQDPQAVEALLRGSNDRDYPVRQAAIEALRGMGPAATVWGIASVVRQMLPELERGDRQEVVSQLVAAGAPGAGAVVGEQDIDAAIEGTASESEEGLFAETASAPPPPIVAIPDEEEEHEPVVAPPPAAAAPVATAPPRRRRSWLVWLPVALLVVAAAAAAATTIGGDEPQSRTSGPKAEATPAPGTPSGGPGSAAQRRRAARARKTATRHHAAVLRHERALARAAARRRRHQPAATGPAPPVAPTATPRARATAAPRRSTPAPVATSAPQPAPRPQPQPKPKPQPTPTLDVQQPPPAPTSSP
jgi:HEAT repeat protein